MTVNVESPPVIAINAVPDDFYKIASEKIAGDYSFGIISPDLISAIGRVESKWRHCCEKEGQTSAKTCVPTNEIDCPEERIIASVSDGKKQSFGIMQIHYQGKSIPIVDPIVKKECPGF